MSVSALAGIYDRRSVADVEGVEFLVVPSNRSPFVIIISIVVRKYILEFLGKRSSYVLGNFHAC